MRRADFTCPSCGSSVPAPASLAGHAAPCPRCKTHIEYWPEPLSGPLELLRVPRKAWVAAAVVALLCLGAIVGPRLVKPAQTPVAVVPPTNVTPADEPEPVRRPAAEGRALEGPTPKDPRDVKPGGPPPEDYPAGRPRGELPIIRKSVELLRVPEGRSVVVIGKLTQAVINQFADDDPHVAAPIIEIAFPDGRLVACYCKAANRAGYKTWRQKNPPGTEVTFQGTFWGSMGGTYDVQDALLLPDGFR